MRSREASFQNQACLILYITQEESSLPEAIEKIEGYKKNYKNISIFISGSRSMEDTLTQLVKAQDI